MQNEPNFQESQMNVIKALTRDYENKTLGQSGKNEPKTNPIKANLLKAKMNVNFYSTKDYENISNWTLFENKPNTNPIKPNQKRRGEQNCISSRKATLFPKKPQNLSGKMPDPAWVGLENKAGFVILTYLVVVAWASSPRKHGQDDRATCNND